MGMYAQTDFTIRTDSRNSAEEVEKALKSMKVDEHGNDFATGERAKLTVDGGLTKSGEPWGEVSGFMDSGRIQNLEYQCEQVWLAVKGIEGVEEMDAPFMMEAEGIYHSKDDEEEEQNAQCGHGVDKDKPCEECDGDTR